MPDESQQTITTEEVQEDAAGTDEGVPAAVEVVAYTDVLDAVDKAADGAAERVRAEFEGQMSQYDADAAARENEAIAAAADAAAQKSSEVAAGSVADRYDAIVEDVREAVKSGIEEQELDGTEVVATISGEQWEFMKSEIQTLATMSVLSLLMCALLAGILLSQILLERWRT